MHVMHTRRRPGCSDRVGEAGASFIAQAGQVGERLVGQGFFAAKQNTDARDVEKETVRATSWLPTSDL
jgi:hypothetical protein